MWSDREQRQIIALRSSVASSSSGGTSRRNYSCPARANHDRLLSWSSVPPRAPLWLAVKSVLSLLCVMVGVLRVVSAAGDALVDIRPDWKSLDDASGATVGEVFRSSEVLQMYHLQVCICITYAGWGVMWDTSVFFPLAVWLRVMCSDRLEKVMPTAVFVRWKHDREENGKCVCGSRYVWSLNTHKVRR